MAVVTVVTVAVIEVDTGLTIVAVIAVVPVMAIVRLLNNGVFADGSYAHPRWRGCAGSVAEPKQTSPATGMIHFKAMCYSLAVPA